MGVGQPRCVLEIWTAQRIELCDVGQVEEPPSGVHLVRGDSEPLHEAGKHPGRDRARHLHAHDRSEATLAQVGFDGLEEIVRVVGDLGVSVAGQPEERTLHDLHLGEESRQEVRQHGLERHEEPTRADRDEPVEALGHLDPGKALFPRLGIANEQPKAQGET